MSGGMSSVYAWLTPDSAPADAKCWRVFVPGGEKWEAAFRGALALLAMSENWEQFGSLTPEEAAQYFVETNFFTYEMEPCMPVGVVQWYAGSALPDGFLWCDGGSHLVADYPELWGAIGFSFGGSGANFNAPNLVDQFIYGIAGGAGIGNTGGQSNVTLTESQIPSHKHTIPATVTSLNDVPVGVVPVLTPGVLPAYTGNTGGDGSHENKPPYIRLHAIIRHG